MLTFSVFWPKPPLILSSVVKVAAPINVVPTMLLPQRPTIVSTPSVPVEPAEPIKPGRVFTLVVSELVKEAQKSIVFNELRQVCRCLLGLTHRPPNRTRYALPRFVTWMRIA